MIFFICKAINIYEFNACRILFYSVLLTFLLSLLFQFYYHNVILHGVLYLSLNKSYSLKSSGNKIKYLMMSFLDKNPYGTVKEKRWLMWWAMLFLINYTFSDFEHIFVNYINSIRLIICFIFTKKVWYILIMLYFKASGNIMRINSTLI